MMQLSQSPLIARIASLLRAAKPADDRQFPGIATRFAGAVLNCPLIESGTGELDRRIVDSAGQNRAVYFPLAVYAIVKTATLRGISTPPAVHVALEATIPDVAFSAATGEQSAAAAWTALGQLAAGCVSAAEFFRRMASRQQPGGAWLSTTPSDNIETLGYDELVLLHATQTAADLLGTPGFDDAIAANARYQLAQLQPDHATTQPWAIAAFARHPDTRPLAESLLHNTVVQQPAGLNGLPVVLLADALYGLSRHSTPI